MWTIYFIYFRIAFCMSKYKYFLKVTYSCGILEENAEKEWKDDISCVLWNIFNDELGDSEYLSVCVGCNDAGSGVWRRIWNRSIS